MTCSLLPSRGELDDILVGPDSVTWRRVSDVRLNLVMVHALLLQVAHPTVGAGVQDFSEFERNPWRRLMRTVDYVTVLVYGGELALERGRRLRELHRRFRGTRPDGRRYTALEPRAYAWVHATLIQTYVVGHAEFGTPLSDEELERFYTEYRRLGRLIGVRARDLPDTWNAFSDYFEQMTAEELVRTRAVERVLRALRQAPPPLHLPRLAWRAIRIPVADAMWLGGVGPMAPQLRERLEIPWGWHDEARFRALGGLSRRLGPVLPERLRVAGPGQLRRVTRRPQH
jgi:uncharacterized protein (DUF2236 family)